MSNNYRELTGREKQRIKKLVTSLCANYDKEYGCLPLDRKSTRLNSSHIEESRMPSSA